MQDIGDMYAPCNHNKFAATVLHLFEGGQCPRVVEKNANLQMSYNAVHLGANPNKTEIYHGDLYLDDRPDFTKVAIRQALSVIMKAIQSNFLPIL